MTSLRKTFILLSAAIAMGPLAGQASAGEAPSEKDKVKSGEAKKKKHVAKQRRARKRPADFDDDFGMPAGTAYDVMSRSDLTEG